MNTQQNSAGKRRPTSSSGSTPRKVPVARKAPTQKPTNQSASASHPARRKEPHYPSSNRPSFASKLSAARRRNDDDDDDDYIGGGSTAVSSLVKAVIYIVSILVVSGFLSYFAIVIGNDIFAFVKSDEEITVSIGEGTTIKELGEVLEENGVIEFAWAFDFYADIRDKNPALVAGEYTVTPSMNYDQLIRVFAKKNNAKAETVIVTIPEGYTVKEIVDTLVDKYHLSSREELYDVIENYEFDYWFIEKLDQNRSPLRKYRLEGYLYPDTYYYYSNASAVTIINKMLKNFDVKMKQTFKNCTAPGDDYIEKINNLCTSRGMTFDEIVNLASLIQMEAYHDVEYGTISSVFNNRLKYPGRETGGFLGSDATFYYILQDNPPDKLTQDILNMDDPYNTRLYKGLPPGPISNPTFLAINYAFYPEKTDYFYFVAKKDGYNLFAKTEKEHEKNKQEAFGDSE